MGNNEIVKVSALAKVEVSINEIKQYICPTASDTELVMFQKKCEHYGLNPFLNEIYLVKFKDQPAQTIVSKDSMLSRAYENPNYKGMKSGIVVETVKGELVEREGTIKLPKESIIGGWCIVYNDRLDNPVVVKPLFSEYNKGRAMWLTMPCTMIEKVAIARALRNAFPKMFAGQYIEEEMAHPTDPPLSPSPESTNTKWDLPESTDEGIGDNNVQDTSKHEGHMATGEAEEVKPPAPPVDIDAEGSYSEAQKALFWALGSAKMLGKYIPELTDPKKGAAALKAKMNKDLGTKLNSSNQMSRRQIEKILAKWTKEFEELDAAAVAQRENPPIEETTEAAY